MPTPAWLTNQNVYFNGVTTPSMLIKTVTTDRYLVIWDALAELDQQRFVDLVAGYGGSLPIAATGGFQVVDVAGVLGTDPTGLANDATVYTASISVDGTPNAISIVGSAAQTYTTLLSEINADLTGATATLDGNGNIRVENDSGAGTTVAITDTDLFSSLTDFVAIGTAWIGVDDLESAMNLNIVADNGQTFWSIYWSLVKICGVKPTVWASHNYNDVYWDGSVWKRYVDDTTVP